MAIADRDTVRRLTGGRSTDILPDSDIDEVIEFSDSLVKTMTNKTNWDTTDPAYYAIQKASEYFASSELLSRWQDTEEDSKEHWERADYIIKGVVANLLTATAGEDPTNVINIESGVYQTFPLNPNAKYSRPGGRTLASGEYMEALRGYY
jgi:hypothetical protein